MLLNPGDRKPQSQEWPKINRELEIDHENGNEEVRNYSFPFGMIQTSFQIMANCSVKLRNSKVDNPAKFLEDLFRF